MLDPCSPSLQPPRFRAINNALRETSGGFRYPLSGVADYALSRLTY